MSPGHWLMKAEPDSRVVKGKDVKFSVDDFENVKTTPWEGVRNAEARNLMKEMKEGDQVLFYHSNCKVPGIAAFAETRELPPTDTAWDPSHPYYDQKTDKEKPKWYMVDVTFVSRAAHFIPLALLRKISLVSEDDVPEEVAYIGEEGVKSIKQMALVTRGRLSVQRVDEKTWDVIQQMADKGGWDADTVTRSKAKARPAPAGKNRKTKSTARRSRQAREDEDEGDGAEDAPDEQQIEKPTTKSQGRKRKAEEDHDEAAAKSNPRRSTRARK
ncbi:PUA-like domain-containing protein [Fomitopsis serialis]|uniref:PUA-like domain-containing protein n=1 Tax=Fomitopsis serialis TaxID=139415 RepID=UPI002007A54E|nr:PUA-like domain-containing protein [Neoantrodia serialis]KAH9927299.1 PUA-like domain-containing protein [Neoantrodia serialis]